MSDMTRRDWMAAFALAGMLSSEAGGDGVCPTGSNAGHMEWKKKVAQDAYEWADAMILVSSGE